MKFNSAAIFTKLYFEGFNTSFQNFRKVEWKSFIHSDSSSTWTLQRRQTRTPAAGLQRWRQPCQAIHVKKIELPRQLVDDDGPGRCRCKIPIQEASQSSRSPDAVANVHAVVHGEPISAVMLSHTTKIPSRVWSIAKTLRTGLQQK